MCGLEGTAWHRFWTPPSPDTFPTSPTLLFLCVLGSKTSLQAWLIFRRLHSQRHPFTSQSKRTPHGPDPSVQGPMWGPCTEQGRVEAGKEGRNWSVFAWPTALAWGLSLYKEDEDTAQGWRFVGHHGVWKLC